MFDGSTRNKVSFRTGSILHPERGARYYSLRRAIKISLLRSKKQIWLSFGALPLFWYGFVMISGCSNLIIGGLDDDDLEGRDARDHHSV